MCDIKTPYRKKTKTVYKIVYKGEDDGYYSVVTGARVALGPVSKWKFPTKIEAKTSYRGITHPQHFSIEGVRDPKNPYFNSLMIGRTCGLSSLRSARRWIYGDVTYHDYGTYHILKIKLGGSIYVGTSKSFLEYPLVPVYAGSEVLSFKEVE